MKSIKLTALLLLLAIASPGAAFARKKVSLSDYDTYKIRDLALIYQGNNTRPAWDMKGFVPYLSHEFADGHRDWTFDGFLFLETNNGEGTTFYPSLGKMGTKADWQWYLDRLFTEGTALDALDNCIDSLKTVIGEPGFKHKVVLTIPTPCLKTENWGEVDGKTLDLSKYDDAAKAAGWYIDQIVKRFNDHNYKNLELTGLYWLDEDLCHTFELPKYVAPLVHAKNLDFIWIPYYNARGIGTWREMGFDMVYIQPNYLFSKDVHHLRLKDATDMAHGLGTGMEFEMDRKSLYEHEPESTYNRMRDYIEWFDEAGVWERSGIAYYTGNDAIREMGESIQPLNKRLLDRLFSKIVERRNNPKLIKK